MRRTPPTPRPVTPADHPRRRQITRYQLFTLNHLEPVSYPDIHRLSTTFPVIYPNREIKKNYTATVNVSSLRVTARYSVSRSNGIRPASVISRTRSARRIPCGVVAPAS